MADVKHSVNFFEIPTKDLDRAVSFYENVLKCGFRRGTAGETKLAMFAVEGVTGALINHKERPPTGGGTVVYLDANGDIDGCVSRVEKAGGKVVVGKTDIGEPGYIALINDTEGNLVGIHTPKPESRFAS